MSNDTSTIPPSPETPARPKAQLDFGEINRKTLEANRACVERTRPLAALLLKLKQQLLLYVTTHKAKGTEEGDAKAAVNQELADEIDATLKVFRESAATDPVPGEQPQG